jgi:methionine synthase I (cobalamin-dependent)
MTFQQLLARGPTLSDGAWGTEFLRQGLDLSEPADTWNLRYPDRVAAVARSYVAAGSCVLLTNTFRANRVTLEAAGCAANLAAINRAGVEISRQAARGQAAVFASLGPTGKLLAAGQVSEQQLHEVFAEQLEALAAGNPDAFLLETFSDLKEALIALAEARRFGLPVVVSFVFDAGRHRDRTMTGVTPEQAAAAVAEGGASAVGANCGSGIDGFLPLTRRLAAVTQLPLWVKPNAGLPEMEGDRAVYRTTPSAFAAFVPALIEAGAHFIGGCCGTNPAFIRAMAEQLDQLRCA